MPIYEYGCEKCWTTWEMVRAIRNMDMSQRCPSCDKEAKHQRREVNDCHFSFVGGMPSFEGEGYWDAPDDEEEGSLM